VYLPAEHQNTWKLLWGRKSACVVMDWQPNICGQDQEEFLENEQAVFSLLDDEVAEKGV